MIVPRVVEEISAKVSEKKDVLSVRLMCKCGNDRFFVRSASKNNNPDLERDFLKRFGKGFEARSNAQGEVFFIKRKWFGKIIDTAPAKEYLSLQNRVVFFAKCSECHKEYIIYDNWQNRYDSIECKKNLESEKETQTGSYSEKDHTKNKASQVFVSFRYEGTEDMKESIDDDISEEDFSNYFSEITIYVSDENSLRKRKIYQEETM